MIRRVLIVLGLGLAFLLAFAIGTLVTVIQEWLRCTA